LTWYKPALIGPPLDVYWLHLLWQLLQGATPESLVVHALGQCCASPYCGLFAPSGIQALSFQLLFDFLLDSQLALVQGIVQRLLPIG